ncbi:MAG TPA: nucleotidyltransferase domain-containing protein [Herpetosiphonaceae bacterium]|nr:nucleotidyltransferase domain-containing protein [Herpetosiphonaceae bacterium]
MTGYPQADAVLEDLTARLTAARPDHFAACYVEGSYADRTAVATSDLDLTIALRDAPFGSQPNGEVRAILDECKRASPLELDIAVRDIEELRGQPDPQFMLGARLVHGVDVRAELPAPDAAAWGRERMHSAFWLVNHVFGRPTPVRLPLEFPLPGQPWHGYAERRMRLADGGEIRTTRDLVRVTGWIATARVAREAGQFVVRKHEAAASYARWVGDEWTPLLAQIDEHCRRRWQYRLPDDAAGQALLTDLLRRTLGFENDFAERYRRFALAELACGDSRRQMIALERLAQTPVDDPAVVAALAAAGGG